MNIGGCTGARHSPIWNNILMIVGEPEKLKDMWAENFRWDGALDLKNVRRAKKTKKII